MPTFVYDPSNPEAAAGALNTATSGFAETGLSKPKRKKPKRKKPVSSGSPAASTTTTSSSSAAADTGKNNDSSGGKVTVDPNNPLTMRFMTPKQIREEAARLAVMGVPSEQAIKQQYAAEQAGIEGVSTALSNRLGDIAVQQTAGLKGFGDLYSQLAAGAQAAGQSQLAAAGAGPATVAAGGTPTVASGLFNVAKSITGYQPAAEARRNMLVGESLANLRKSLVDRASRVSADTAKYIQSLSDRELQRAVSQTSAEQNALRLGLAQEQEAWNQKVDVERIQQGNERIAQSWARINDARLKAGGSGAKAVKKVKETILADPTKWTEPRSVFSGTNTYKIVVDTALGGPQEFTVQGASPEDALASARVKYPSVANNPNVNTGNLTYVGPVQSQELPKRGDVVTMLVNQLVNAGMGRNAARKWVIVNIPGISSLPV